MQFFGAVYPPYVDSQTIVKGSADGTKRLRIEVDGLTTGTTRVWTAPDADLVVVGTTTTQTLTNKTLTNVILDGTTPLTITQSAATSGSPRLAVITGGAHTTLTASTETHDIFFALNRTVQWSTGAITLQRAIFINPPTYAFVGASTITTAATLAIGGAPIAGTNATITTGYALLLESGDMGFNSGEIKFAGGLCRISVTASATGLTFVGNMNGAGSGTDFVLNTQQTRTAGNLFALRANNVNRITVAFHGGITFAQGAASSGTAQLLVLNPGAHTGQAASTEVANVTLNAYTRTWATGGITTQREFLINAPTYAFNGASTITTAASFAITGAPIAGTNATITTSLSLWVQAGTSRFDGSTIAHGATAIPAGGTTGAGIFFSSTGNFGVMFGSGAPSASAAKGTLYLRSDGSGTTDRAYINTNGSTTWTALTTVA